MCEVSFCSFNVTFYAWLMENIDGQTNDETFVLHSEVLLADAKYCYLSLD